MRSTALEGKGIRVGMMMFAVAKKGRGRLLDYLMEFLVFPCYIERAEK
jgi:hypothetical protein